MSYSAQCLICAHALRGARHVQIAALKMNAPLPVGCGRLAPLEVSGTENDERAILNALLYQTAAKGQCVAFERIVIQPDAYFAKDAP